MSTAVAIPDARIHEHCVKCQQWFEPEDGETISLRGGGPFDQLRKVGDQFMGKDRSLRFMCHDCIERRQRQRKILTIIVAIMAVLFMAACAAVTVYLLMSRR